MGSPTVPLHLTLNLKIKPYSRSLNYILKLVAHKRSQVMYLLVLSKYTDRKLLYGKRHWTTRFVLTWPLKVKSHSLFEVLCTFHKYMMSPMPPSYRETLKGQSQSHSDFEGLYLARRWAGPYLTNTLNYIGNHAWRVQMHHHIWP